MLLLMSVQEQEWDDVDLAIRQFQGMTQAIKFSPKPVVSAPFGLCLGGGTEFHCTPQRASRTPNSTPAWSRSEWVCCPAHGRLQGDAVARAVDSGSVLAEKASGQALAGSVEMMEAIKKAFEPSPPPRSPPRRRKRAASASSPTPNRITMNRERVLSDAKARASNSHEQEYERQCRAPISPRPAKAFWLRLKWASTSCAKATSSPTMK